MKRFVYIKPVRHVQIGHVYEHLYYYRLVQAFREQGLFAYVDYSIDARTYYDGYVYLEVFLYNSRAQRVADLIKTIHITPDEDHINGALLQIMAEKHANIATIDDKVLLDTLQEYDISPWLPLEDLSVESFKPTRKTHRGLSFSNRSTRQFATMTQRIQLDTSSVSLDRNIAKALFIVVANTLRQNLQDAIAESSFCYSVDDTFTMKRGALVDINTYRIDKRQATELTTEAETAQEFITEVEKYNLIQSIVDFLGSASIDKHLSMPSEQEVMDKVGIVVGEKGWHAISTRQDIQQLLRHTTIEFRLGKMKQTIRFSTLLTDTNAKPL
ncbi:MAG TPA: hypothetical protein VN081_00170 [Dongiaceae bacterium]|nr:hypothetical protein [Dongiaceae bacterium]